MQHMVNPYPSVWTTAEREAVATGTQRLLLLTTRTADWFEQRGFQLEGAAHLSDLLPDARRAQVWPVADKLWRDT